MLSKSNERSKIRYAIFRCKSLNGDQEHLDIFDLYKPLMDEFNLPLSEFSITWDIGKEDLNSIIQGFEVTSQRNALFTQNEKALRVSSQ